MSWRRRRASKPIAGPAAELDRLGDEIAELSAHLDAATARLLDLIREFDARGGWGNGFLSCAHGLTWRVGLEPRAARERVRVARALGARTRAIPHIRHWAHGGPTTLSNLTMLCRVRSPALPPVPADPIGTLRARNEADGIHIDAETSKPGWLGERLDVGYAIDVLHPLATGERRTES